MADRMGLSGLMRAGLTRAGLMRAGLNRRAALKWGAALTAALSLAGCDDPWRISQVRKAAGFDMSYLTTQSSGVPVVIHGLPYEDVTAEQVVGALRTPGKFPAGIRFRFVDPADGHAFPGRLILTHNRTDAPDANADCRRSDAPSTLAPPDVGLSVQMTFCGGAKMLATGVLDAPKHAPGDLDAYANLMANLMLHIFDGRRD